MENSTEKITFMKAKAIATGDVLVGVQEARVLFYNFIKDANGNQTLIASLKHDGLARFEIDMKPFEAPTKHRITNEIHWQMNQALDVKHTYDKDYVIGNNYSEIKPWKVVKNDAIALHYCMCINLTEKRIMKLESGLGYKRLPSTIEGLTELFQGISMERSAKLELLDVIQEICEISDGEINQYIKAIGA